MNDTPCRKPPLTVTCTVHVQRSARGRKQLELGEAPPALPPGRVPRLSRFMALALRLDRLLREGVVQNTEQLARLGHVTRARVCQIRSLVYLAPDLQETLLFLPLTEQRRDPLVLRDVLPITTEWSWPQQRLLWQTLVDRKANERGAPGNTGKAQP